MEINHRKMSLTDLGSRKQLEHMQSTIKIIRVSELNNVLIIQLAIYDEVICILRRMEDSSVG